MLYLCFYNISTDLGSMRERVREREREIGEREEKSERVIEMEYILYNVYILRKRRVWKLFSFWH